MFMRNRHPFAYFRTALGALLLALAVFAPVRAQQAATATLEGVVTDPQGAVIANAKLVIKNQQNGLTRELQTDGSGVYRFVALQPGTYDLSVSAPNFTEAKRSSIVLTVGQKLNLDVALTVGASSESITIIEQAPVVETTRTNVASSVGAKQVSSLPVNGRNFLDFVTLTPGVVRDPRGGDLSFGGQKGTLNSIQIDGVDNNNLFFGQSLGRTGSGRAPYQFSQDAVQEFQVNTNSFSAEFGRAAGGTINVITKSGGNDFHGTGFEFFRDRSLNANSLRYDAGLETFTGGRPALIPNGFRFDSATSSIVGSRDKPPYHFHQFGGNLGGPIKKDHAFFFFNYDGQRNTQPNILNVLPAATATDPASVAGRNRLLPLANNYVRGFNQDVYLAKADWQLTAANRLSFRYNRQKFTGVNLESNGANVAQEHSGNSLVTTDSFSVTLNTTLTPRLLNEFRLQLARDREPGLANSDAPEAVITNGGQAALTIGRNNFSPRETTEKKYQFIDNVSYIAGQHSLKGGADLNFERIKNFFPGFQGAGYTFTSYANFTNNIVASYTQAFAGDGTTGFTTFPNFDEYGFFALDDWRAQKSLTINLGLRYDVQQLKQGPTRNPNAALTAAGIDTSRNNNDHNNFAPRFGFAWSPAKNDRLVVRGGYGLFYGRTPSIALGTAHSNNGLNSISVTLTNPTGLVYPFRFASLADIQARGGQPAALNLFVFERNYQQPYTMQGSLGVEYGLTNDLSVNASYLSVQGRHLQRTRDINLPVPVASAISGGIVSTFLRYPGTASPTRPITGFGRIAEFESNANSSYNALILQINKRFAKHYQYLFAYTFSKVIDDAPDATSVVTANAGDDTKQAQYSTLLSDERGVGNANVPHRVVVSGLWNLDYFKGTGPARQLLGGWEVSGILQASSNLPFSARLAANVDLNNDGNRNSDRAPGFGRNSFYQGHFVTFDFRTTKNFFITEKFRLQFIAEFFNLFNRINIPGNLVNGQLYNVTGVNTAGVTPTLTRRNDFGNPRGAADPRIGQLALKLIF
ncbi:MAG: TonB-dependent receptor [Acidobacteria bacterium]|nr:TonB-dependent receptor [Acidobacteriota bacterium]MBI3427558.1 TonB-dependent receptor [Acidobacteriota bacterium]